MERNAVIDFRTDPISVRMLEQQGIRIVFTKPINNLYDAVTGHTDMQLHCVDKCTAVCAPEVYSYYKEHLPEYVRLVCGSAAVGKAYPEDIAYNAAVIGGVVVCNERFTAPEILELHRSAGRKILNVRQGYAKCSTAVISDTAAITADEGIYSALTANGIDTLKIRPGFIRLDGVSYGFIGGVCGLISKNILAVNGDIQKHPDGRAIETFCNEHGVKILKLNSGEMYDIGSIVVF